MLRTVRCLLGVMGAMALLAVPAKADPYVDVPASLDCTVYARHDDENDCDSEVLEAGVEGTDAVWHFGSLMKFNVSGNLPGCAIVTSASLNLYGIANQESWLAAYRMLDGWNSGVTWATYNGTNAWPGGGLDFAGDSFASDPDDAPTFDQEMSESWHSFDVTDMTYKWASALEPNVGVFVRADPSKTLGDFEFASSEDETNAPYLHVEYFVAPC